MIKFIIIGGLNYGKRKKKSTQGTNDRWQGSWRCWKKKALKWSMEHTESRRRGPWLFRAVARAFLIRIVRAASAPVKQC